MGEHINLTDAQLMQKAVDLLGSRNPKVFATEVGYTGNVDRVIEGKSKLAELSRSIVERFVSHEQALELATHQQAGRLSYAEMVCSKSIKLDGAEFLHHMIGCSLCLARVLVDTGKVPH